jgi:aminobenzoyl-glutamate transport protein
MKTKLIAYVTVFLAAAQVLLVLLSWLLSAMMTEGVRSLLSSEGIRWFFGQYTDMLQSPVLIWMLLLSMAAGALSQSRMLCRPSSYRERMALRIALFILLCYAACIMALTLLPHAILLSATGSLFPSPFSKALVPVVAFGLLSAAIAYGLAARTFRSVTDICNSITQGIAQWAPFFLLYVFFMQLYKSVLFVLI